MKSIGWLLLLTLSNIYSVVHATDYEAIIDLPGAVELSLPVSGVIRTLNAVAGQHVKQGDELLTLDSIPFQAAKDSAESRVAVKQTLLAESLRDFKNRQELYDRTVLATVQLENAELKVKRDKAFLKNAEAQLALANYELSYSRLTAPFNALILSVYVNQGQSINNSIETKTLISLVRQGQYRARFNVTADGLNKFKIGQAVTIKYQGNSYPGSISGISFKPENAGKGRDSSYMVEASFKSEKQQLSIGNNASVSVD